MTAIHRRGAASAALLAGLCLSIMTAHAAAPNWSRRAGLDVWNITALERAYQIAAEERADVNANEERAAARRAAASHTAAKLVADPSRLPDVADELVEVFQQDNGLRFVLGSMYPAAPTPRHLFARHAIDRVCTLLENDPVRREALLARLEGEYQAMCAGPGSPHAP